MKIPSLEHASFVPSCLNELRGKGEQAIVRVHCRSSFESNRVIYIDVSRLVALPYIMRCRGGCWSTHGITNEV